MMLRFNLVPDETRRTVYHPAEISAGSGPFGFGRTIRAALREAWRRHRSRTHLATLSDRMLKDIGVTRAEAEFEANKPFWKG